jgi:hypothetical protein
LDINRKGACPRLRASQRIFKEDKRQKVKVKVNKEKGKGVSDRQNPVGVGYQ